MILGRMMTRSGSQTFRFMGIARFNQEDLVTLEGAWDPEKLPPVIERQYPLSEVPEAVSYLLEGLTHRGKIVITMG